MKNPVRIDIRKIKHQLNRARLACLAAIELGDCRTVARLTCEIARLKSYLGIASSLAC